MGTYFVVRKILPSAFVCTAGVALISFPPPPPWWETNKCDPHLSYLAHKVQKIKGLLMLLYRLAVETVVLLFRVAVVVRWWSRDEAVSIV